MRARSRAQRAARGAHARGSKKEGQSSAELNGEACVVTEARGRQRGTEAEQGPPQNLRAYLSFFLASILAACGSGHGTSGSSWAAALVRYAVPARRQSERGRGAPPRSAGQATPAQNGGGGSPGTRLLRRLAQLLLLLALPLRQGLLVQLNVLQAEKAPPAYRSCSVAPGHRSTSPR